MNITKPNVIMLIIGRISDENLTFLTMIHSFCAKIGKGRTSLLGMTKDASFSVHANTVMAGKNKSIILCATRPNHVKKKSVSKISNAPFITTIMIKGKYQIPNSSPVSVKTSSLV